MNLLDKIKKVFKNPLWIVVFLNNRGFHILNDEKYIKLLYRLNFNKNIDLNKPRTYNEKLQWLKLHDRKDIYTTMVDKYEVKKYVCNIIGKEYIVPTLGIYDKWKEINFDELPSQFVIKCTHYGGNKGVHIIKDKSNINLMNIKKDISKVLKKNLYYSGREWPYKNVRPRIIIEKYLVDSTINEMRDYKFFCFNGKVCLWFICSNRKDNVKFTFFDRNGNFLDIKQCGALNDRNVKKPKNLNKMIELAEKLSENMTQIRVDFYEINDKIYFSELTFFDTSGFGKFDPEYWDAKIGDMIKLPYEK